MPIELINLILNKLFKLLFKSCFNVKFNEIQEPVLLVLHFLTRSNKNFQCNLINKI